FKDTRHWPARVNRLGACALDRLVYRRNLQVIDSAELWADGGPQAHNSGRTRMSCTKHDARDAFCSAGAWERHPLFQQRWAVVADIAGPRQLPVLPAGWDTWESGTIPAMAEEIYQKRTWKECKVLADALEDAKDELQDSRCDVA